jgi:ABC-type antimicrobial peptide transport system permease subunit
MARRYWPGEDPIGKRVKMEWFRNLDAEVVGVVPDVRLRSLDEAPGETLYWPNAQSPYSTMTFMIRSRLPVQTLMPQAKAAVASLDPALPLGKVQSLEQVVEGQLGRPRFTLVLTATFGILAGLLAAVGIYGVIAHSVHERRAEVGVRVALGATPRDLIRLVLGNALLPAGTGILLGSAVAVAGTRVMRGVLYETSPADPVAYAAAAALVLAVSILAGGIPARRAARIDPIKALRCE